MVTIPCVAFELAALTFDGDLDENATKRPFHVLLHSYPSSRGLPDSTSEMREHPVSCCKDLEVFEETDLV